MKNLLFVLALISAQTFSATYQGNADDLAFEINKLGINISKLGQIQQEDMCKTAITAKGYFGAASFIQSKDYAHAQLTLEVSAWLLRQAKINGCLNPQQIALYAQQTDKIIEKISKYRQ